MHVGLKPELHTHTERGLRFLLLLHIAYRWANSQPHSVKMSSQGVMSGKATNYQYTIKEDAINSTERNILGTLIVPQLVKKLRFMELESSIPLSQTPSTCPYPKPYESSHSIPFL